MIKKRVLEKGKKTEGKLTFCRPRPIRRLAASRVGAVYPTRVRVGARPRLPAVPKADPMVHYLQILAVLKHFLHST